MSEGECWMDEEIKRVFIMTMVTLMRALFFLLKLQVIGEGGEPKISWCVVVLC